MPIDKKWTTPLVVLAVILILLCLLAAFRKAVATWTLRSGSSELTQHNDVSAVRDFKFAVLLDPNDYVARDYYAVALIRQKKFAEAIRELRTEIRLHPSSTYGHYNLAEALRDEDKADQAIAEWRLSIQYGGRSSPAYTDLAWALIDAHKYAESDIIAQQGVRYTPGDYLAYEALGCAYLR
ncbi:MAG: hypothetical protein JWQ02_518, partial [Capsulimonas sp.]|nr:hypothetical protein [Capsulimonas sp.]